MPTDFAAKYAKALSRMCDPARPQDCSSAGNIKAAEKRLGLSLPKALSAFYRILGRHRITVCHNRLARLSGRKKQFEPILSKRKKWLYFMEENQVVCEWAIQTEDCERDDPSVFQDYGDCENLLREGKCSEFLISFLYWQGFMGGANFSAVTNVSKVHIQTISKNYTLLTKLCGIQNFGNDSLVAGIVGNELYVAARNEQSYKELESLLGVDWNFCSWGA